jgi:ribosome-binding factor A
MSNMHLQDPSKRKRPLRVAAEILRSLPEILRSITLPDGVMISITDVEVTDDLGLAKVYFSVLGEHEEQTALQIQHLLNSKKGVVRHEISQRMVMRQHPEFKFIYDSTPASAARIEALLKQVRESSSGEAGEQA